MNTSSAERSSRDVVYADRLVRLTSTSIRFGLYYFPFGPKTVPLDRIARIQTFDANRAGGGLRIWGSGDLRIWCPCDVSRHMRKTIFLLQQKHKRMRIGFTVENEELFKEAIQQQGVIVEPASADEEKKANAGVFVFMAAFMMILGLLTIGMGVPHIAKMVPPNTSYGLRIPTTLTDEHVWYAANQFSGVTLLFAGLLQLAGARVLWVKRNTWPAGYAIAFFMLVPIALALAMGASLVYAGLLVR